MSDPRHLPLSFVVCRLSLGIDRKVIERGTHDVLMELDGEYANMWNIQVQERERMLSMEAVSRGGDSKPPLNCSEGFSLALHGGEWGRGDGAEGGVHRTFV